MSTPNLPSAEQLAANRITLWHQGGDALLTLESLRAWLNKAGLVLYTPRAAQLPAPAPSLVEAVLGAPNLESTMVENSEARSLLARLIGEGSAVPLNLLGTTGETPDFVVSAAVFPYIFTVRGDKAWKLPPATQGPVKVSPLALAAYEALARRVTLSAAELVDELGKEVTEGAVLRALSELWAHLRVIPVPQNDGPTMWELTSTRFTKQIKAGANAGQPKALSALISLYLGMAVVATEEEIETILSPLASRSRIRDVVHALMGARELETIAVDGRTVVHVAGDLSAFAAPEAGSSKEGIQVEAAVESEATVTLEGEERIKKFVAKPRKVGTGFTKSFNPRPATGAVGGDRERRPFKKSFDGPSKPSFTKPWDENRPARPAADNSEGGSSERPRYDRDKRPAFGAKPFGARPSFGGKPSFSRNTEGGTRPTFRRDDTGRPPRREFTQRPSAEGAGSFDASARPERKTFSKPGTFGRKREGGFSPRPSFDRGEARPQRSFGGRDSGSPDAPRRPYNSDRGDRPSFGAKPSGEQRRPGSYSPRPSGGEGFAGRKPFTPRTEGGGYAARKPFTPGGKPGFSRDRDQSASGSDAPRKVFRKFDAPRFDKPKSTRPFNPDGPARPAYGDRPSRPAYGDRPSRPSSSDLPQGGFSKPGAFAGKKPFGAGRPSGHGSRPTGTFAKFADGAKPFRKPGPGGKKFGPKTGGGGKTFGGPRPEYRKRKPEEGESA